MDSIAGPKGRGEGVTCLLSLTAKIAKCSVSMACGDLHPGIRETEEQRLVEQVVRMRPLKVPT